MRIKKIILISIFIFSILPSGNIFAQTTDDKTNSEPNTEGIQKLVEDNTPIFIKKIIAKTIQTAETFRVATWQFLENKRTKAKEDLERQEPIETKDITLEENRFEDSFDDVMEETRHGMFVKPLKYAELFFLTTTAAFFKNNVVFYIVSVILIFFMFRTLTKQ